MVKVKDLTFEVYDIITEAQEQGLTLEEQEQNEYIYATYNELFNAGFEVGDFTEVDLDKLFIWEHDKEYNIWFIDKVLTEAIEDMLNA